VRASLLRTLAHCYCALNYCVLLFLNNKTIVKYLYFIVDDGRTTVTFVFTGASTRV